MSRWNLRASSVRCVRSQVGFLDYGVTCQHWCSVWIWTLAFAVGNPWLGDIEDCSVMDQSCGPLHAEYKIFQTKRVQKVQSPIAQCHRIVLYRFAMFIQDSFHDILRLSSLHAVQLQVAKSSSGSQSFWCRPRRARPCRISAVCNQHELPVPGRK